MYCRFRYPSRRNNFGAAAKAFEELSVLEHKNYESLAGPAHSTAPGDMLVCAVSRINYLALESVPPPRHC